MPAILRSETQQHSPWLGRHPYDSCAYTQYRDMRTLHLWVYRIQSSQSRTERLRTPCAGSVHHAGVGQHLPAVLAASPATLMTWGKVIFSLLMLYSNAVAFPKLSILALYLRIFTEKPYRITAWILAILISTTALAVSLTAVFQCSPIAYAWNKTIPGGTCINVALFYVYCSIPNVITDVAILLLPIPMIFKLHTSRGQKFGLLLVFSLGTM